MQILEGFMGDSWRSTTLGVLSILLGLALFLTGWATDEGTLKVLGLGMIPTGILGLVTRDNSASKVAHQESLDKIAETRHHAAVKHEENAQAITTVIDTAQAVAAETAKAVVDEKMK